MSGEERWLDLRSRVLAGAALVVVGGFAIVAGGSVFLLLVLLAVAGMLWELSRMTSPQPMPALDYGLAALALLSLFLWTAMQWPPAAWTVLALPAFILGATPRRDRWANAAYALGVMVAGAGFLSLYAASALAFLWLVGVVVASDTLGYLAGRLIGGPKFWPSISPKKTWAGTIAGWAGAALVGLGFGLYSDVPVALLWLSPVVALAGQFGDIGESWIKRRCGVKDASGLIPGHGGLLDRFDALLGAMLAVQVIDLILLGLA